MLARLQAVAQPKVRCALGSVLLVVGISAPFTGTAAAADPPSLTVTPSTGVNGGQTVLAVATGYEPGHEVAICQIGVAVDVTDPAAFMECDSTADGGTKYVIVTADAAGRATANVRLERVVLGLFGNDNDCATLTARCGLLATDWTDGTGPAQTVGLQFAPPPSPPTTRGVLDLDPLPSGELVVTGTGFRPHAPINVHQCYAWAVDPLRCSYQRLGIPTSDGDGAFQVTITPTTYTTSADGHTTIQCEERGFACVIAAGEAVDFAGTATGTLLPFPDLAIGTGTVMEGNGGLRTLTIPVTLSEPSPFEVGLDWRTVHAPGLAGDQATPGSDYAAGVGTVTFPPATTTASIQVTVYGDTAIEADEYLVLQATGATMGEVGGLWGLGFGTIANDDLPALSALGAGVVEGDTGTRVVRVPVMLDRPSPFPVTVDWATVAASYPGLATAGVDYLAASGTLTFAPGTTAASIPVTVLGDETLEPPVLWGEWGFIELSAPTNASIDTSFFFGLGIFVIIEDD